MPVNAVINAAKPDTARTGEIAGEALGAGVAGHSHAGHTREERSPVDRPRFDLFVSRQSAGRRKADVLVRRLLEALLPPAGFELTVIDVHEQPDRARQAGILATPTLIRRSPGPELRVIGDLSNQEAILGRFALRCR